MPTNREVTSALKLAVKIMLGKHKPLSYYTFDANLLLTQGVKTPATERANAAYEKITNAIGVIEKYINEPKQATLDLAEYNGGQCKWVWNDDNITLHGWDTSCGDMFSFYDGTPDENNFIWCPFCGREIVVNGIQVQEA